MEKLYKRQREELEEDNIVINEIKNNKEILGRILNICLPNIQRREIIPRRRYEKRNLWESEIGKLICSENVSDPLSFEGKKFRLRFRIPFCIFQEIVQGCKSKERDIFQMKRESSIPVEIKIAISLRILGRGDCFDSVSEISGVPVSTCQTIFHNFCQGFVEQYYKEYISFPEDNELKKVNDVYAKVGFPGACGSMDVTHFRWDSCPKDLWNLCKGRYPYPTLAVQTIVDHNRRILYISDAFCGRENDKTITMNDKFTVSIALNGKLGNVEYKLYNKDGNIMKCRGGYLIVDGGYQKIGAFIDPLAEISSRNVVRWTEYIESVRKDVECTFGILKSRFRILKHALEYSNPDNINNVIKCCAILHNILLSFDNRLTFEWERCCDWDNEDPELPDEEINNHQPTLFNDNPLIDYSLEEPEIMVKSYCCSSKVDYNILHNDLIDHFHIQRNKRELQYPKRFTEESKRYFPIVQSNDNSNNVVEVIGI